MIILTVFCVIAFSITIIGALIYFKEIEKDDMLNM